MAKKKKTTSRKKRKTTEAKDIRPDSENISVDLNRARNGYIISSYRNGKSIKYIAQTKEEAMDYADKLLKRKK